MRYLSLDEAVDASTLRVVQWKGSQHRSGVAEDGK
jgi:hypothetical protein